MRSPGGRGALHDSLAVNPALNKHWRGRLKRLQSASQRRGRRMTSAGTLAASSKRKEKPVAAMEPTLSRPTGSKVKTAARRAASSGHIDQRLGSSAQKPNGRI